MERLRQNLEWALGGVTLLAIAAFFSYLAFLLVRDLWSWSLSAWLRGLGSLLVLAILLLGGLLFAYVLTRVSTWLRSTADEGPLFLVFLVILCARRRRISLSTIRKHTAIPTGRIWES